jgi:transcriptional regulator with GAF, ATPase, and Fis domain
MPGNLIGASVRFQAVLDEIAIVASVDSAVLLQGETGTGKELVARAIHDGGPRRARRFVAVNCAAIPAPLLENEFFGSERGAYTGAVAQTIGRFQAADGGTLFLDEIGDLPLELQPKLLRVLQEQQVERLGSGGRGVKVDVRVIAATNQDLGRMVEERSFRADLYYRLSVYPIVLPTLRERKEDIPLLVMYFVGRFSERHRKAITHVPDDLIKDLQQRSWPGNIRELQNVIERAVIATPGNVLQLPPRDLPPSSSASPIRTLRDAERAHIAAALQETKGVVGGWNGAAARLGLSRTTLIAKMQKLGLAEMSSHSAKRRTEASGTRLREAI